MAENIIIEPPEKYCMCMSCGHKQKATFGIPCNEIHCPSCGNPLENVLGGQR